MSSGSDGRKYGDGEGFSFDNNICLTFCRPQELSPDIRRRRGDEEEEERRRGGGVGEEEEEQEEEKEEKKLSPDI